MADTNGNKRTERKIHVYQLEEPAAVNLTAWITTGELDNLSWADTLKRPV